MSTLPDHLRHAKHVGRPHPGCAVCWAKLDPKVKAALERVSGYQATRPVALCVSADEVQARSLDEVSADSRWQHIQHKWDKTFRELSKR